jgi:hypothetical protein
MSRADKIRIALLAAIAALAFTALALIFASIPAGAHDDAAWIESGGYKNAAGELCCGARDCAVKVAGTIAAVVGGYRVDARFRLKGDPSSDYRVKEFVPYAEATPSPDGSYWRCQWGGSRKCFFAPPPNT